MLKRLLPLGLALACSNAEDIGTQVSAAGPGPDYTVTAIQTPPTLYQPFVAQVTVCNDGDAWAPGGDVELYASPDPTITPGPMGDFWLGNQWF